MPLVVDGRLHGQAVAHEETAVAAAVAGAVHVRLVLVLDHFGERHRGLDVVEGA